MIYLFRRGANPYAFALALAKLYPQGQRYSLGLELFPVLFTKSAVTFENRYHTVDWQFTTADAQIKLKQLHLSIQN